MMKTMQTEKLLAPRERAPKPEPRPAEEPGGTVESPRGKGVAVTQQFILTLPLRSSKQGEVICPLYAAMPSAMGILLPNGGSDVAISDSKKKKKGGVAEGKCAPWDCSFVYRSIAVQSGSPRH